MFSIEFANEEVEYPYDDANIPAAPGTLTLNAERESFLANLSLWNRTTYEAHWRRELSDLLVGREKVALVVSYDDPHASSNMEIWRVYSDGEVAFFQNQLVPYSQLPSSFDVSRMSDYIEDRVTGTADGQQISEWEIALSEIRSFIQRNGTT
jgi:hypothetical protein